MDGEFEGHRVRQAVDLRWPTLLGKGSGKLWFADQNRPQSPSGDSVTLKVKVGSPRKIEAPHLVADCQQLLSVDVDHRLQVARVHDVLRDDCAVWGLPDLGASSYDRVKVVQKHDIDVFTKAVRLRRLGVHEEELRETTLPKVVQQSGPTAIGVSNAPRMEASRHDRLFVMPFCCMDNRSGCRVIRAMASFLVAWRGPARDLCMSHQRGIDPRN